MSNKDKIQIYLRLKGEEVEHFLRIKESVGLKNDTEVLRSVIKWYWKTHEDELVPQLIYVNVDEHGVKVFDKSIPKVVDVLFSREGVKCNYCGRDSCRHVEFSLNQPDVLKVVRKRRKEGWNLPEV